MISVCLVSHNGELYIKDQIYSILNQLSEEDELLIYDDNSSDNTIKIVENIRDRRIRIINNFHPLLKKQIEYVNANQEVKWAGLIPKITLNFINTILFSKGDYIFLSDQDDIWVNEKVPDCLEKMKNGRDLIVHGRQDVDSNLKSIIKTRNKKERKINLISVLKKPPFQGACMGFTGEVREMIKHNINIILKSKLSHDHIIGFLTWIIKGKSNILIHEKPLILYRRHSNNASFTGTKSKNSLLFKIMYRIEVLILLLKFITVKYKIH